VGFSGCLIATTTLWLCGTFQVRAASEKLSPAPAATAS
ncbi:MAG: hypothetical protein JWO82_2328, partial [Akkermansiaceae bacterium]|nr:hypothetical protein [Akkermansiaceae bacterium]